MKILIAGDFCPLYRVTKKFEQRDFRFVLGDVKDVISSADYSVVNFECPVTRGGEEPIDKCGPNLQCSEKGMEAVKWTGFNCVTLANNHFYDYGANGVSNTINLCNKHDIDVVGGGDNISDASEVLYKQVAGNIIAIINCCEHEFSLSSEKKPGSNPLNPIRQYYSIVEAKKQADFVLVIVHGGHEHYQLPSPRMQELYRFFIDIGADAVVNHHQHCYSGYEVYNEKPIFYGLGNFCFDNEGKRNSIWNEGFMLMLNVEHMHKAEFQLFPYRQCDESPQVVLLKAVEADKFFDNIRKLNNIIADKIELEEKFNSFCKSRENDLLISLMPYKTRLLKALGYRHMMPTFVDKKKAMQLYDFIACESHRDTFLHFLNNLYDKKN